MKKELIANSTKKIIRCKKKEKTRKNITNKKLWG